MSLASIVFTAAALLTALALAPGARRLRPSRGGPAPTRRLRSKRSPIAVPDYAAVLDAIARQVRSGSSLTSAIFDEVDPASSLGPAADHLLAGRSLVDAPADPVGNHPDLLLTVQALSATAHLGGPVAATLDEAATVLRERVAARAERRAHGAQARLSARVLTVVPVGFAVWSAVASQHTRDVYISSVAGGACAVCGLMLNVAGWHWMKRIIGPT